ncbi:MAG: hypothetical protein IJH52_04080 [Oscillospiraceae bacterium]|nr:hypothetical protein [Oscillospiraceae bacterium]MBQ6402506.1 hypothetical protein [Oscillospiraceae bacterium]
MKKQLLSIGCAVCFALLLTVSALAAGLDKTPEMNTQGFLTLALMSGALAVAVALILQYVKKFQEINRKEKQNQKKKKRK